MSQTDLEFQEAGTNEVVSSQFYYGKNSPPISFYSLCHSSQDKGLWARVQLA